MSDISKILSQIESGDPAAAEQLLPLVYEELRKLAAVRIAQESPGQTLQATALVHEAYLRLVSGEPELQWDSRGHFLAAAGEAMRRILVENARRKRRIKHGGGRMRMDVDELALEAPQPPEDLLALDAALTKLQTVDALAAKLVHLRYFAGLTLDEAADALQIPSRSADRHWAYARAWLHREIQKSLISK